MTRRLRYTSNLDELHLQSRVMDAARAFVDRQGQGAVEALHDVFDCLAEERDHYFSSDPHLIDLNLTSESTVEALVDVIAGAESSPPAEADGAPLATPTNVLMGAPVARQLASRSPESMSRLCELLQSGHVGWAGGAPEDDVCFDLCTSTGAEQALVDAHREATESVGTAPLVYGRFRGSTPIDVAGVLSRLGYLGVIPIDFAGGTGFGDEAKVILQASDVEIEALTARPIDASSDAAFLCLGSRLGEAIDSGEIATALLAHWPGKQCDSFDDLRRVATWCLALGRFWSLDAYFPRRRATVPSRRRPVV